VERVAYDQRWFINKCPACGHGFVVNRPSLEQLERIYSGDMSHHPTGGEPPPDRPIRLVSRLARLTDERGQSLDVGSGNGEFSFQLHKLGFRPVMIDLDPRAREMARHVPGGDFRFTTFEDFTHPGPFSAIIMSQVLEHALDPMAWLRRARDLLSPRGVLAVALPNFEGAYRVLGKKDPFLTPPIHLNFFTRRSLALAFEAAGLTPLAFDSDSKVRPHRPDHGPSLKRRVLGRAWNLFAVVLNPTTLGIMLQGYAGRRGRG
jgi:2-polyprenyl-3-methyl-5-hydroxy-6-metoxy-1,4-benzoquinol methylase